MYIIVGNMDERMLKFIRQSKFDSPYRIINKHCKLSNLKNSKEEVTIIIPFGYLLNNDLVSNTKVHLPELLLSLNVSALYYFNSYNENRIIKICNDFEIPCYKKNLI